MAAKKKAATQKKKAATKRELIAPHSDTRYFRRDAGGRIKESDDVGRSLVGQIWAENPSESAPPIASKTALSQIRFCLGRKQWISAHWEWGAAW